MAQHDTKKIYGKFKITPITPIHISDSEGYNTFEYYIIPSEKRFYLVDTLKFFQDNAEDYERAIKILEDGKSILEPKYIRYTLPVYSVNLERSRDNTKEPIRPSKQIHAFIKDPFGQPFIPGSSLKGCIRTAITCALICEQEELLNKIFEEIIEDRKDYERRQKNRDLESNSSYGPSHNRKDKQQKILDPYLIPLKDVKYDLFKALVIRDSQPFPLRKFNSDYLEIPHFGICQAAVFNRYKKSIKNTGIELYCESLLPDLKEPIEIPFTIDKFTLEKVIDAAENQLQEEENHKDNEKELQFFHDNKCRFERLKVILSDEKEFKSALKIFSKFLREAQVKNFFNLNDQPQIPQDIKNAFQDLSKLFEEDKDAIYLQIGFRTGYLSKTIALAYDDETIAEIANELHLGRGKYSVPGNPFPRSKVLTTSVNNLNLTLPMGWFKLEIEWDSR